MTKKKLIAVILVVSFVLFCGASYLNFSSALKHAESECNAAFSADVSNVRGKIAQFNQSEEKDVENLQENLRINSVLFNSDLNENRAYAYAVTDREGNVIFESESGVWFWNGRDTEYISLEKYMTPEIKKEISDFKKKSEGDFLLASKLCVNLTDGVYVPVSLEITDNRFEPDNNESITVNFTDREVTDTFNEYLTCEFYNLENNPEYDEVGEKLEKKLKTFDYSCNASGSSEFFNQNTKAEMCVIETVGDYHFIGFVDCNLVKTALNSELFSGSMIKTAIVFVALTAAAFCFGTVKLKKRVTAAEMTAKSAMPENEKTKADNN